MKPKLDVKVGQLFLDGTSKKPGEPSFVWELVEILPEWNSYRLMVYSSNDQRPWSNTLRAGALDYCIMRELMVSVGEIRKEKSDGRQRATGTASAATVPA